MRVQFSNKNIESSALTFLHRPHHHRPPFHRILQLLQNSEALSLHTPSSRTEPNSGRCIQLAGDYTVQAVHIDLVVLRSCLPDWVFPLPVWDPRVTRYTLHLEMVDSKREEGYW